LEALLGAERAPLLATLSRLLRDVELAEEVTQDALVQALRRWPREGVPQRPGAWLLTTARNAARDRFRAAKLSSAKGTALLTELQLAPAPWEAAFAAIDEPIRDDPLRLLFVCAHPKLPPDAQVALALRLLGGLTVEEIGRAFLQPPPTIAQRLVRAKRTIAELRLPFEVPAGDDLRARLPTVLQSIYLIFNEGFSAASGAALLRLDLCDEAIRLARLAAGLLPDEPEAHGLCGLLELQHARRATRIDAEGRMVLLEHQDRSRWDGPLLLSGLGRLADAHRAAGTRSNWAGGRYQIEAALAACHAVAPTFAETNWTMIAGLYAALQRIAPSPVVELNRAVAVGMGEGPAAGLHALEGLAGPLRNFHLYWSVRADFLRRLGRRAEAVLAYREALARAENAVERTFLEGRLSDCTPAE